LLPARTDKIIAYLQDHVQSLNARTLERRLVALKHWHNYQGFADPTNHPSVRKILKGIKNLHGKPKNKAPALNLEQLTQMVAYLKEHGERK